MASNRDSVPLLKRTGTAAYPTPTKKRLRDPSRKDFDEDDDAQVNIFRAVENGNLELVKNLIEESGPAVRTLNTNSTLLHEAAVNNHPDIVRFLLKMISPNVVNKYGHTPVLLAALRGHSKVLKILIADEEMNPDKRDCHHRTYKDLLLKPILPIKWEKSEIAQLVKGNLSPELSKYLKKRHPGSDTASNQLAINFNDLSLGPLRLMVTPCECRKSGPNVYKMDTDPRGYVCVLTYNYFKDRPDLALEGSYSDIHNLANVFNKMGYHGEVYASLSADDTKTVLNEVRDKELLDRVGCGIFIISSHGFGKRNFLTSDMMHLNTEWICSLFGDSECPGLKNKPKLFIFDFCNGYYKGQTLDTSQSYKRVDEPLENIVCLYSGNGGLTSYTFTKDGTPFITSLCRTLADHAHNMELGDFYREFLKDYLKTNPTSIPELQNLGFNKDFYFNPVPPPQ